MQVSFKLGCFSVPFRLLWSFRFGGFTYQLLYEPKYEYDIGKSMRLEKGFIGQGNNNLIQTLFKSFLRNLSSCTLHFSFLF